MRFEKGHKEATRRKIIETAAAKFRRDGIEAVGIAGLMADAGLTHGGFYAHFESKEALVRAAIDAALDKTRARMDQAGARDNAGIEGVIRTYLRPSHRDMPERGCAIASLGAELARHEPATKAAFSTQVTAFLERIAAYLPAEMPDEVLRAKAVGILSVMLGALQLSRVVGDVKRADEILANGIDAALKLATS